MSKAIEDGGSAFPVHGFSSGMSLRDYFAAHALPLAAASLTAGDKVDDLLVKLTAGAYKVADAMLKAREVQP